MLSINRIPHDRLLDRQPAGRGTAPVGKMAVTDVPRRVQVAVRPVRTGPALKARTVSVAALDVATGVASLAGVAGIDPDHPTASRLGLVFQERPHLSERPAVQPSAGGSSPLHHTSTDFGQALNHDRCTGAGRLSDALREDVVAVPPKPSDLPGQLPKMPAGRWRAFGLQTALQTEGAAINLAPALPAKEACLTRNRRSGKAEIDADGRSRGGEWHVGQRNGDVQPELAVSRDQVGAVGTGRTGQKIGRVRVGRERDNLPTGDRGEAGRLTDEPVRPYIVADRHQRPAWAASPTPLPLPSQRRLHRFGGSDAGRDYQLGRQRRVFGTERVVGRLMQRDAVSLAVLPSIRCDLVEARRGRGQRPQEDGALFWQRLQTDTDRTSHAHIVEDFATSRRATRCSIPLLDTASSFWERF